MSKQYGRQGKKNSAETFWASKRHGSLWSVRDTKHPRYDKDYQGLHHDTCDVVEYRHGYQNAEKGCWEMSDDDIKCLTDYCASLNGA